jgi:hypothetical protein
VADNSKGCTNLCTRMRSMPKDQNLNSSKSSTPYSPRNSRHQLATHIHRPHWTTPRIKRIQRDQHDSGQKIKTSPFHQNQHGIIIGRTSEDIQRQYLQTSWITREGHQRSRTTICFKIYDQPLPLIGNYRKSLHSIPPTDRWTNGMN